ncbi:MAG TPA: hypothetical protein VF615_01855 [Longimicrobiaceae bacterium]|jgi:hypothetical protein
MDEQHLPQSEPRLAARVEDEISDDELDDVAGGLARIWMGEATIVAGRPEPGPGARRS